MNAPKKVFVCSPYSGDVVANVIQARAFCRIEVDAGNIPLAPHLIFTQFLNDNNPKERDRGIAMGLELMMLCDELHVYGQSITEGMAREINAWRDMGRKEQRVSLSLSLIIKKTDVS